MDTSITYEHIIQERGFVELWKNTNNGIAIKRTWAGHFACLQDSRDYAKYACESAEIPPHTCHSEVVRNKPIPETSAQPSNLYAKVYSRGWA